MQKRNRFISIVWICLLLLISCCLFSEDWPQWRGINRDGKSSDTGLFKQWPAEGPALIWKSAGFGKAYSGVSVVGERLYTLGGGDDANTLFALSAKDGSILWSTKFGIGGPVGGGNYSYFGPRSNPTVNGNLIFAVDQFGELICVNTNGKVQWKKHFQTDFGGTLPRWGFSESPLVDGDRIVVTPGGAKGAMVALNKNTGEVIWQSSEFTDLAHYASIVVAEIEGVRQYIQLTEQSVVGISPRDGTVLWKAARAGRVAVIPTPVVDGSYVYVTSGYNVGSHLFKVTSSAGKFTAEQVYASNNMENHHGGVVKVGDAVYGYSDGKGLVCQNFLTGEILWSEREKIKKGALSWADGMLYFREEKSGAMILAEAVTSGYSEKGRFEQSDRAKEMAWAHPVISNGRLYLRDQDRLLCYALR